MVVPLPSALSETVKLTPRDTTIVNLSVNLHNEYRNEDVPIN